MEKLILLAIAFLVFTGLVSAVCTDPSSCMDACSASGQGCFAGTNPGIIYNCPTGNSVCLGPPPSGPAGNEQLTMAPTAEGECTQVNPVKVTFSWNLVNNAEWYIVYLWNETVDWMPGAYKMSYNCGARCEDIWDNFPSGTTHWWVVYAGIGTTVWTSDVNQFMTPCDDATNCKCPLPPPQPNPNAVCEKIITWSPYTGSNFDKYAIQYSLVNSFPDNIFTGITGPITPQTSSTYTLTGLASDVKYYYRVLVGITDTAKSGWWCEPGQGCISILDSSSFIVPQDKCTTATSDAYYSMCVCRNYRADVVMESDGAGGTRWVYANKREDRKYCGSCFYKSACPDNGDPATV